jgi:biopolymer transport protein ExbB/TolQ
MTGLVKSTCCCCGGESVDPSQKARILAEGISEAMNCTAFGLVIGILSLIAFACLNGRTQRLEDEMRAMSVHLVGLVEANREKLGLPSTTTGA